MAIILIVEDDIPFSRLLENFLQKQGMETNIAHNIKTAYAFLRQSSYDLALLDYRLPDGLGIEVLEFIREKQPHIPSIIMTSFHDIRTAVKTIRSGAFDYITKPVNPDELLLVVREVLGKKAHQQLPKKALSDFIKGTDDISKKFYEHIQLVAPTDFSVILEGDSGTGKELAARNIHNLSKRADARFIALDCGALSSDLAGSELFGHVKGAFTGALQNKRGLFEEANGGTLFLDEVGNLSYDIQVKLLRAIQEREIQPVGSNQQRKVDTRIICATNENLINAVKNGKFREDLYHRLNEFKIRVPSLNERKEDIMLFVDFFIDQTNNELEKRVKSISPEVHDFFLKYDWPGNLRELRNIIKRAVLLTNGNEIGTAQLPFEMLAVQEITAADTSLKNIQDTNEKELIIATLKNVKYNKSKAARLLDIDRTTLYYKMAKYNID